MIQSTSKDSSCTDETQTKNKAASVCMLKTRLQDFHSDDQEALWAFLRPKRLPRGFCNLIVPVVYHPNQHPDNSDAALNDYLTASLDKIEGKFPNNGILIAGDFSKFDFKAPAKCYQLEPVIKIPTRGKNTVDQIYTNLKEYYKPPKSGPAWVSLTTYLSRSCPTFVRNPKPRVRSSKRATKDLVAWLVLVVIC